MRISAGLSFALAWAAVLGMGAEASAQDIRKTSTSPNEWENEIALYFWMPRMGGEVEIQNVDLDVDGDFDDMLKDLDSSIGLHYELWEHDSWGIAGDFFRMVLSDDPDVPAGDGELETEILLAEALFIGRTRSGQAYLDVFGGFRWMSLDSHFEGGGVDEDRSRSYLDPIIGIRVGAMLSPWFHLSFRFDIGGFDVGTDFSTNTVFLATAYASPTVKFSAGWRTYAFRIDDSDHEFSLTVDGPLISVHFGF